MEYRSILAEGMNETWSRYYLNFPQPKRQGHFFIGWAMPAAVSSNEHPSAANGIQNENFAPMRANSKRTMRLVCIAHSTLWRRCDETIHVFLWTRHTHGLIRRNSGISEHVDTSATTHTSCRGARCCDSCHRRCGCTTRVISGAQR